MLIEPFSGDRENLWALFALADDSQAQIATYLAQGEIFVAREGDALIGHAQLVETAEPGVLELKSLAVLEEYRGCGVGRALVERGIAASRAKSARSLIVSTASADIANLRFYQRRGFRMVRIVSDAFSPATGYPEGILIDGIFLRDQVIFELKFTA